MPHERYDLGTLDQPYSTRLSTAYRQLVVRTIGGVLIASVLFWLGPTRFLRYDPFYWGLPSEHYEQVSHLIGFEVVPSSPHANAIKFFVTRLESPWIWGPLVAAGVLSVLLAYCRRSKSGSR